MNISYYGNRCQYHNHRLTVALAINTTLVSRFGRKTEHSLSPVIRIVTFLLYHNGTIDHSIHTINFIVNNQYNKIPTYEKTDKIFYLNYPWMLLDKIHQPEHYRNAYRIRILLYNIDLDYAQLFSVWEYDIKYPFLPAYRLAAVLHIDTIKQRQTRLKQVYASNQCKHGKYYPITNDIHGYYCDCEIGWNGKTCNYSIHHQLSSNTLKNIGDTCANGSIYFPTFYNVDKDIYTSFVCVCPANTFGLTCHLSKSAACDFGTCKNGGTCLSYINDYYHDVNVCFCKSNYYGALCQYNETRLTLNIKTVWHDTIMILQFITWFTDLAFIGHQYFLADIKSNKSYKLYLPVTTSFQAILLKVYDDNNNIYLLSSRENETNGEDENDVSSLTFTVSQNDETILQKYRCLHVNELGLAPKHYSAENMYQILKLYHRPCHHQHNQSVTCFYDPKTYFCLCNKNLHRASCFHYNSNYDKCHYCLNKGKCYFGDREKNLNNWICLCPKCHYGSMCQYRTDQLGFSLETLLAFDRYSTDKIITEGINDEDEGSASY
ncbi:unnamed protein product [Didymodactylos carnosus]|uniref:EGF-like domain-containing protein n=1 Tax=Didymodactylos carnosus TaxID=1234261 RepID=A0A8S2PW49_9BILA|nr:unnamed protein product [Didymodactylos carnosus]CAF4068974.1 unnamed protein product [Didymodactylos carnosus]